MKIFLNKKKTKSVIMIVSIQKAFIEKELSKEEKDKKREYARE